MQESIRRMGCDVPSERDRSSVVPVDLPVAVHSNSQASFARLGGQFECVVACID
jgi:hypothetical protein